jgi:hypothetical protein
MANRTSTLATNKIGLETLEMTPGNSIPAGSLWVATFYIFFNEKLSTWLLTYSRVLGITLLTYSRVSHVFVLTYSRVFARKTATVLGS